MDGPGWLAGWPPAEGTMVVLGSVLALLLLGTVERSILAARRRGDPAVRAKLGSLGAWWVFFGLFATLLLLGPVAIVVALAAASLGLLRETFRLAGHARWYPLGAALAVPAFVVVGQGHVDLLVRGLPLVAPPVWLAERLWRRFSSDRAPRHAGTVTEAWLLGVVGPLYAAGVARLPTIASWMGDSLGWFVLLVVLTELNDSAQAWWGRSLGRHRMAPRLSPGKTWEGLVGGIGTMAIASLLVAPLVTPWGLRVPPGTDGAASPWVWCVGFAVILGLGGTIGDLLGSSLKRRAGVKDSGRLIPGQGGLLDRLDSLTLTAPILYLAVWLLWLP